MGKILEAFAEENLCTNQPCMPQTAVYQKASAQVDTLVQQLKCKLEQEDRIALDELVDAVTREGLVLNEARFIHGFRLGARMMIEVMEGTDDFLRSERYQQR